jgi:hypothetical protein
VRLTVFWERMTAQFGAVYAQSVAKDYVLAGLGGRTVERALADGADVKAVWSAVCEAFDVPERLRLGTVRGASTAGSRYPRRCRSEAECRAWWRSRYRPGTCLTAG